MNSHSDPLKVIGLGGFVTALSLNWTLLLGFDSRGFGAVLGFRTWIGLVNKNIYLVIINNSLMFWSCPFCAI